MNEFDGEYNAKLTDKDPDFKFFGMYRGYVIDDEDPRDIGRVKIRVIGVFREECEDEDIPWALPAMGMYRSGGNNMKPEMGSDISQKDLKKAFNKTGTGGMYTVPARGSHVWVFFEQGNHMHPNYFAMAPCDDDWLTQKQYLKDKLETKIKQIHTFKEKFKPEDGTKGFDGKDWGDGAHINARQNISSGGQKAPYKKGGGTAQENKDSGDTELKDGSKYEKRKINLNNEDEQGKQTKNMEDEKEREWGNGVTLDIKPLFDKEDLEIDRSKNPHKLDKDWKIDDPKEDGRNINRYVTSFTTQGGTTIIIDNREEQENFYLIHKNYIENIDQDGSRKIFIGQNDPREKLLRKTDKDDERNKGPKKEIRSNDELAVSGDKKIHILGNFVTYTKGNVFTQVDKNMQIDVNDSYGIRIKKGDFDIVIDGEDNAQQRDKDSDRENGKTKGGSQTQYGDLNIAIKNGHLELFVKENANIHVEGMANLMVNGEMRTHVKKSYHLYVEGDYCEYVGGNKYETVQKNVEKRYNFDSKGHTKTEIFGEEFKDIHKSKHLRVGQGGKGNEYKWIRNDQSFIILGGRFTDITESEDIKIGKDFRRENIGEFYSKVGQGRIDFVNNSYEIKANTGEIRLQSKQDFNVYIDGKLNVKAASEMYFSAPSDFKIVGNLNVSNQLKVASNGSFGSKVYASDFGNSSLSLASHRHTQGPGDDSGAGGTTTTGYGGSASRLPPNTNGNVAIPNNPIPPVEPTEAELGKNDGGGTQMESDPSPVNIVFPNEQNETESKNQTKLAKRKHKKQSIGRNRKEKPL